MKKFIKKIMGLGVVAGLLLESFPVWALVKDETIYAKLENNGQVNKVIISEHLQGTGEGKTFDRSKLDEIKNVNGEEKFTKDGNKLVWESNGKDIYYQGQTKEELPISLNIKYYFNGEESTIKDMLGKKGTVKMVLKYTNNDKHEEKINGRYTTLYTPFVVATTTILSNDINYNIKVKNGKVIGNGTKSIVVLLSTPGLYESLGIDKLKGMDEAEITFDTDSFELASIYSVSTPKLIDSNDLDMLNNIDSIYNSVNTLVDSSNKLKSGSNQLLNGATQLKDGLVKLKDGVNSAYNGSKQITDGLTNTLNALASNPSLTDEQLAAIIYQAKQGVDKEFTNNFQVDVDTFATNAAKAKVDAKFTDQYKAAIGNQAVTAIRANAGYIAYKNQVDQFEANEEFMTLYNTCSSEGLDEATQAMCDANQNLKTYKTLNSILNALEETAYATAVNTAYNTALTSAKEAILAAYDTATKTAEKVSEQTAKGVADQAKSTTTDSLTTLLNALTQLTGGLNEINNGMITLDTGTSTLKDGIAALDNGIYQFNSQGISKISNLVNGDVRTLEEKIKVLGKLSINYGTFDDSETGTEGATKIIMVVDEISSNKTNINTVDKNISDTQSLWDKIKEELNKVKNKK